MVAVTTSKAKSSTLQKTAMTKVTIKKPSAKKAKKVSFPFTNVPKGQKINFSKINNPLNPKKLANPKIKSMAESVAELEQNDDIMEFINTQKANNKKFDPKKIGKIENRAIGLTTFNEIAQRMQNTVHSYNILTHLDEGLLSPVFLTKQADGTGSCFDTQHGISLVGLLAKHGLWGNDPTNWLDFEFPAFVIDEPHPSFTAEAALHRNGKGQKRWETYDHHKIKVAAVRQHNNPTRSKEYEDAEARQTICEKLEAIPMPEKHLDYGKAGTLTRTDVIYQWSLESLYFILSTHKTYWHGTKVDSEAWGLYGHLIENMKRNNFPTDGKKWDTFLDEINAIIAEVFTDLATLRIATYRAYTKYFRKAHPNLKTVPTCPHNAALSIVMKIYKDVGGTYYLTGDVFDYAQNGCDIYNELDDDYKEIIKNAKN